MNFKKNIFFVFYGVILFIFLIAGFLRSNVSEVKAESSPAPAGSRPLKNLVIKDVKIETSDVEIKISGKLFNQSQNIATPQITHLLVLETIDPLIKPKNEIDQMPPLIVLADEGKDYFSLNPNRQKTFSYSFQASQYIPKANYRLSLSFIRSDGKEEAGYSEVVRNFGSSEKEGFLAFDQQSCVLFGRNGERFGNNSGPAFLPGESPEISCLIKNIGDKELEVYPNVLWKEMFVYGKPLEGKIAEEKQNEKIFFNPGELKTIALFMPIAEKPQTYQGLLSFKDESGASRSFNTFFRWTVSGESARIKSVAQTSKLKDFYDKGDIVSLSVDYFGSSDLYWAGEQAVSNLSDPTMKVVIKDKNGNICGEKEEILPEITDGFSKNKAVEVVLDKKCKRMIYSVSLSSGQKKLAEQSGDLPKFVNIQNTLQYFYFGAPAFLSLLAFYLFIRKKSVPVYFFIFTLAGVASFYGVVIAETKTFPESGGDAYGIEWGGKWINDGSAVLYSTAYGTGGLNKLRPNYVNAQLKGFFIDNTGVGDVDINYDTDDTSCLNTSMEVEYEVYMGANGEESFLTNAHRLYNVGYGKYSQYISIPSDKINWLYNENGMPKTSPKLIVKMKQIGMYGTEEFNYEYEWVGTGLGNYIYDGELGSYTEVGGGYGDYILKKIANTTFYPGLFSTAPSEKTTKASAYESSDVIRIEIPLLLPTPTLRLKPLSLTINPGQTKQFSVFYDADGPSSGFPEEDVTAKIGARGIDNWSSDDTAVVKVNETGLATAVASGSAEIKVKYYRGIVAKARTSVPSLRIKPVWAEMTVESGRQFKSVYDEDGWGLFFDEKEVTGQSVWISDNPDSATVENKKNILSGKGKGWVSALKKESANISADYSGLRAVSYVLVKDVSIPLKVSCSVDKNPVLVNEQTATFTATAFGGTEPYSYSWTGNDGLAGITDTISKSYSTIGIKNATVEVKDKTATASASCSVEVNDGTVGECDTVKDQCLVGIIDDIEDSESQYLWNCIGTKSTESTDYCSLDKPTTDPSYNVSPEVIEIQVKQSFQFSGIYDSDKTDTSNAIADVTKLAKWQTVDTSVATIVYEGADAGLATCEKIETTSVKSTYTNAENQTFTSEAVLTCAPADPPNYTLTVNIVGQGSVDGLIGICKQAKCEKSLESGTSGYLRATPDAGYSFSLSKFSGDCSQTIGNVFISDGNDDYSNDDYICDPVTMTSKKEVTVVFEKDGTIGECSATEKNKCLVGTVDNANEDKTQFLWDCVGTKMPVSCSFDKVSAWITATPLEVYEGSVVAVEWGSSENAISCEHLDDGNDSEWKKINKSATSGSFTTSSLGKTNRTYTIKCTDNVSVAEDSVEIKVIEPKKLTVEVIGNGMLLDSVVTSDGEIKLIDCKKDCDENYDFNESVSLEAKPKDGYLFGNWKDCDSVDGNQCILTMDADKKVTATFIQKGDITITVNDINATIVAGLMAKSYYSKKAGEENLKVSDNGGCNTGSLELTADYSKTDKDAGGDFIFNPANNGSFPYNGNFYVKNIPGKTPEGKYPITLTATCILNTTGETIGKTADINLIVKSIFSVWQEN